MTTPRARRPTAPRVVAPVEAGVAQRSVVLPGARRPAGAVVGDVDLVDVVERRRGVPGQHARQPRTEPGADRHDDPALTGLGVEVEQVLDRAEAVRHRHHVAACGDGLARHRRLPGRRRRQQHEVGRRGVGLVGCRGPVAERRHDGRLALAVGVVDQDRIGPAVGDEVAGRAGADSPRTDHEHAHGHLPEVGAAELAPAPRLGRRAAGTAQPQHSGDHAGDAHGGERTSEECHGRTLEGGNMAALTGAEAGAWASWNRASDLILICLGRAMPRLSECLPTVLASEVFDGLASYGPVDVLRDDNPGSEEPGIVDTYA